jgi:hypothetical protein
MLGKFTYQWSKQNQPPMHSKMPLKPKTTLENGSIRKPLFAEMENMP